MDVAVNLKGGSSLIKLPPVFSSDGESIFLCSKNSILEYNSRTGKLTYEYKGIIDNIIGYSCHYYDSYHCLTACSENGKVLTWKTLTHFKTSEKQLSIKKVGSFNIISSDEKDYKAIVSYQKNQQIRFALVNIKDKAFNDYKFTIKPENKYFVGFSKTYFSVAQGNELYFIKVTGKLSRYSIQTTETFTNQAYHPIENTVCTTKKFTCLACHPTENIVLTGDSIGRVVVWQNLFSKEKTQTVFHWHTLPVQTVSFSTSGSYFYSGGEECVLVKWQLENMNNKKFLPRMAAEIQHVAVANDNLYVAVATRDNAVRILDPAMNQITLIQHLILGKHNYTGINYDPRTRGLIMNGNQGHIQFYSPDDMSLMFSIDIVRQNKITNERDCVMSNTEITKVAISKTGCWLATIEEREGEHKEIRLKFWHFNELKQTFELNTNIEDPHNDSVNSMQFEPVDSDANLRCITVGNDKKFKVWNIVDCSTVHKKDSIWECHGIGCFGNLPCSSLSLSENGLMATGFGKILTVWKPDSCELKMKLVNPFSEEIIQKVQFGYGNQNRLLVTASANLLSVWNTLTRTMIWANSLKVDILMANPLLDYMAVITHDKIVSIFLPASSVPIYSSKHVLKKADKIVASSIIPSEYNNDSRLKWYGRAYIYYITSNGELYSVGSSISIPGTAGNIAENDTSMFSLTMPVSKFSLVDSTGPTRHIFEKDASHKTIKEYLEGPIHTMAPIRFTCHSLLKSLVVQK